MFGGRLQGKLNEKYLDCQDRGILCEEHYLRQSMQTFF